MTKNISAFFDRHSDAQHAIQDVRNHQIAVEHISLIASQPRGAAEQGEEGSSRDVGSTGVAAGLTGLGLVGLGTALIPGIGLVLVGGPLAAALGAAGESAEEDAETDTRLRRALIRTGLTTEAQVQAYAESIRQGRILVAVDVNDEQSDAVADVFRRHGGTELTFRRREAV